MNDMMWWVRIEQNKGQSFLAWAKYIFVTYTLPGILVGVLIFAVRALICSMC